MMVLCSAAPGYDGTLFSLAVGTKLGSGLVVRGARTYEGVQAAPIVYLGFFDERIQIFGTGLEFVDFLVGEQLRARTKISFFGDDPLLKTAGPPDIQSSRPTVLEWTTRVELFLPSFRNPIVSLDAAYARELKANQGNYAELGAKISVGRFFLEKERPRVEPQLFATLGYGDSRHNAFWYGAGKGAGFSHVEYGIAVVSPARIDRHFPVFRLFRFDVLGNPTSGPGMLLAQTGGWQVEATVAFGLL